MKKILIITYYWPPAGGPGVQRVLKFAKYLPQFGWMPYILTVKNCESPAIDYSLLKDIPQECVVIKTRSFEPGLLYKILTGKKKKDHIPTFILQKNPDDSFREKLSKWIRANIFIPDAKIGWLPFAVSKGKKIIKKENIDIIMASSPPSTVQIIAKQLTKKTKVPWIADFRDPWTDAFWLRDIKQHSIIKYLDNTLEKKVLKQADSILCSSSHLKQLFMQKVTNDYRVLTNGYDEDDFKGKMIQMRSDKFEIKYTGYMAEDQNPVNFFKAIKQLSTNQGTNISVTFIGKIHETIKKTIIDLNLQNTVELKNYVQHTKLIDELLSAHMLLIIIPNFQFSRNIIPGKVFEYLRTHKYILGIGNKQGDVAKILSKTKCGQMFDFSDDLYRVIMKQFQNWQKKIPLQVNTSEIQTYSRRKLTSNLVTIAEALLE